MIKPCEISLKRKYVIGSAVVMVLLDALLLWTRVYVMVVLFVLVEALILYMQLRPELTYDANGITLYQTVPFRKFHIPWSQVISVEDILRPSPVRPKFAQVRLLAITYRLRDGTRVESHTLDWYQHDGIHAFLNHYESMTASTQGSAESADPDESSPSHMEE